MPDTVKVVEIDHVKEKLIERFAERLKEAYPQSDRNNLDPMICYGDFCDIVDEVATEITDSIANGVTVQQWISVKDRYPDEAGFYIGFFEARPGHWRVSTLHWNGTSWNNIGGYIPISVKTTHWLPLPQPPKGE